MLRFVFALVLLQVFAVSSTWGFGVRPMDSMRSCNADQAVAMKKTQLFASEIDKEKPIIPDIENITPEVPKMKPPKFAVDAIYAIFMFLSNAYSVFILGVGTFFACGLLLNLFGYGYHLSKDGLRIDTLEQMRMENQFENDYRQSMQNQNKPPSSFPQ